MRYEDLPWPTLKALVDHGGSASIQELSEQIASDLDLSDEILDVPDGDQQPGTPCGRVRYQGQHAAGAVVPGRGTGDGPDPGVLSGHCQVARRFGVVRHQQHTAAGDRRQ